MLQLHQRARQEIQEAAAWYRNESSALAARFLTEVGEAFDRLEANPKWHGKLETVAEELPIRCLRLHSFPYHIVFEIFGSDVFVIAFAHGSRRPNYWKRRKRPGS